MRWRLIVCLVVGVLLAAGCSSEDRSTVDVDALQSVEDCMRERGLGANDVTLRYKTEPAFKRALDSCTEDADITSGDVLDVQTEMRRAHADWVRKVAACMAERGRPMEVEVLDDGSANLGELSRYFTPESLDEFFDDYAECDEGERGEFPTEASMEADRKETESP